jgi:hypothetical protein
MLVRPLECHTQNQVSNVDQHVACFFEICSVPYTPCLNNVTVVHKPSGMWSIVLDPIEVLCSTVKNVDVSSINPPVVWFVVSCAWKPSGKLT